MMKTDDEVLAELIGGMLDHSRGRQAESLDDVIARYPRLERELRELWATVQITEDFASLSGLID